jgi:hypothetical protein
MMRLLAILAVFWGGAAQAATITNLTDKPQKIERLGTDAAVVETFVIEPNATWRVPFDVKVRYGSRDTLIHYYEEYAIWSEGSLSPQLSKFTSGGLGR